MGTYTFDETLPTLLDYARWRLDDVKESSPYLSNETYTSLFSTFGPVEGIAIAASAIATKLAKKPTSFGEAAGIRFTKANLNYYESLPDIIRGEPPFGNGSVRLKLIRAGKIKTGLSVAVAYTQIGNP